MAGNSNNYAVGSSCSTASCVHVSSGSYQTGKHWILYFYPLVKLGLFLALINAGVFFFPSHFNFEIARLLVIAALLVTVFSLFVTWIDAQRTRYVLSQKSIQINKHGLNNTSVTHFSCSNIESVVVFQTIVGRFFDYGTLKIKGNSGSCTTLTYVANPNIFRQEY